MANLPSEVNGLTVHYWLDAGIHRVPVHICPCGVLISLNISPSTHISQCEKFKTTKEKHYEAERG